MNSALTPIANKINLKDFYRIAFLGDSLTSCEWVHPNWREIIEYVLKDELTEALNGDWKTAEWYLRCYNAGYDGANSLDLPDLIDKEISVIIPDMVITLWGGNDLLAKLTPAEHAEAVVKNLRQLRAHSPQLAAVFCTNLPSAVLKFTQEYEPYHKELIAALRQDSSVKIVDLFTEYQKLDLSRMFNLTNSNGNADLEIPAGEIDHSHPGTLGNAYIAKLVLDAVWGIKFDPEKYIAEVQNNQMLPGY